MVDASPVTTALRDTWNLLTTNHLTKFALHSVRNVGIFLFIAVAALALHQVVVYFEAKHMPAFITNTLTVAEYGALVIDVVWFLGDLGIRAFRLLQAQWRKPAGAD